MWIKPGKSHGWRSLVGCSPWGREESDTTGQLHFHLSLSCIGEGNGNPLQCSCLKNPRDGGAAIYGVTQSRTLLKRFSSVQIKTQKLNILNFYEKLQDIFMTFGTQFHITLPGIGTNLQCFLAVYTCPNFITTSPALRIFIKKKKSIHIYIKWLKFASL